MFLSVTFCRTIESSGNWDMLPIVLCGLLKMFGILADVILGSLINTTYPVALKVLAHGASAKEMDVIQTLKAQASPASFNRHVVQLLDQFEYEDSNGLHICLVLELMWQNVQDFMEGYRDTEASIRFPLAKRVARQFSEAVKFLEDNGVIHNGTHSLLSKQADDRYPSKELSDQVRRRISDNGRCLGQGQGLRKMWRPCE